MSVLPTPAPLDLLIIEPDAALAAPLSAALADDGYAVGHVATPDEAVALFVARGVSRIWFSDPPPRRRRYGLTPGWNSCVAIPMRPSWRVSRRTPPLTMALTMRGWALPRCCVSHARWTTW